MIPMFLCDNRSYDNSKWFLDNVQTSLSITELFNFMACRVTIHYVGVVLG